MEEEKEEEEEEEEEGKGRPHNNLHYIQKLT